MIRAFPGTPSGGIQQRVAGREDRDFDKEVEEAKEEVKNLEDDPPERLEDWPSGPADVRFHDDGKVSVGREEVDDPDSFKGEPIPGGPTDPNAPGASGEKDRSGGDEPDEDEE